MKEEKNILDKVNRNSGMTTPENYFANFAESMMQNLPEKKEEAFITKPVTTWQRIRPFVYLVAMFAGIWCMVKMVTLITSNSITNGHSTEQIVAEAVADDSFFEEYCYEDFNEYSLLETMYEEGIEAEEIINPDTEN